jgi:hypothetical protein
MNAKNRGYEALTSHIEPYAAFKLVSKIVEEFEKNEE